LNFNIKIQSFAKIRAILLKLRARDADVSGVEEKGALYEYFHIWLAVGRVVGRCGIFLEYGSCTICPADDEGIREHSKIVSVATGVLTL
jgi:hypothetical protein